MSRIANNPIKISKEVECTFKDGIFSAKGKLGQMQTSVNSNYNLGIILLCAPVLKALTEKHKSLRKGIKKILHGTNFNECNLIITAIKYANPAGLKNYEGSSNILKNKLNNKNIVRN